MKSFFIYPLLLCTGFAASAQQQNTKSIDDVTTYYDNGKVLCKGFLKQGRLHNGWTSYYSNGNLLDSGFFHNGIPDGSWKVWNEDGSPRFVRTYSADKWHRFQQEKVLYHPRKFFFPVTRLYRENEKEARRHLTELNSFCPQPVCTLVRDKELLEKAKVNSSADHYHPLFEEGLLHGLYINYFTDGTVKDSGYYRDGLPESIWILRSENKETYWKGAYRHGRKNKEWKLYTADGRLLRIVFFNEGKEQWRREMNKRN